MSTFRDDRVALRSRIQELELELADARKRGDAIEIERKLNELSQEVARAAEDAANAARSLEKLRAELVPGSSTNGNASKLEQPRDRGVSMTLMACAIVLLAAFTYYFVWLR